ncbi:MAG: hypothetical protein DME17_11570 [Candidatus Rokuibacteriota bacterium]|nr:MAG: hypothetical protein DME17_11570 [Candidatus Rokubacteria bacterium]
MTGSTAGIGLVAATALATDGASVVVNGRTPARVTASGRADPARRERTVGSVGWRLTSERRAVSRPSHARCRTPTSGFRVLAAISRAADGAHGDSVERGEWPRGGRTAPSRPARSG